MKTKPSHYDQGKHSSEAIVYETLEWLYQPQFQSAYPPLQQEAPTEQQSTQQFSYYPITLPDGIFNSYIIICFV